MPHSAQSERSRREWVIARWQGDFDPRQTSARTRTHNGATESARLEGNPAALSPRMRADVPSKRERHMTVSSVATTRNAAPVSTQRRHSLPEPYGQFYDSVMAASRRYNLPPEVLFGILKQESGGRVNITGYDGHGQGPWQIDDRWHGDFLRANQNGRDIASSTDYAARLLRNYTDQLGGDLRLGVAAYNAGVGGVQTALRNGRSADSATTGGNYSATIFRNAEEFRGYLGSSAGAPGTTAGAEPPAQPSAPPANAPAGPETAGAQSEYQIKWGDTLWGIASRLKAQGMAGSHWDIINQIVSLNPQIKDPNLIYAGDTLKLPGVTGASATTFVPANTVTPPVDLNPAAPVERVEENGPTNRTAPPFISQYRPNGAERGYYNGPANCGPTSMAMLARAMGYGEGMTDAQLINHLGQKGGTSGDGTNVNGIVAMAQAMGKQGQIRGPGANVDWIREQLQQGKMVVANGDYYAMPPHQNEARTSGHYVLVHGIDAQGRFLVHDPADQNVKSVSAQELAYFINQNPNGGWQIGVG